MFFSPYGAMSFFAENFLVRTTLLLRPVWFHLFCVLDAILVHLVWRYKPCVSTGSTIHGILISREKRHAAMGALTSNGFSPSWRLLQATLARASAAY
jgi:hypothetical protein